MHFCMHSLLSTDPTIPCRKKVVSLIKTLNFNSNFVYKVSPEKNFANITALHIKAEHLESERVNVFTKNLTPFSPRDIALTV